MRLSRRSFLKQTGAVTLAAAGLSLPQVVARTARAAAQTPDNGRILVLVQLTGGNDGLNTVVPFRDDAYYRLRPTLAIPRGDVLRLNDDVGLCPQLGGLRQLYDEGLLHIAQGVGYPNPNRSHFESMDIWHTADPQLRSRESGWLGRALQSDAGLAALHLDGTPLPLALRSTGPDVASIDSIEDFRLPGGDPALRGAIEGLLAATPDGAGEDWQFVRRTAVDAVAHARRLDHLPAGERGTYPDYGLARRLREIARLISADFGPRIYYTSLSGFDTHARQKTIHPRLMSELGDSLRAFFDDLRGQGLAERVALLTFSEFGRRCAENASYGTDHGAAAPVLLAGPAVRAGLSGPSPDLSSLADGDVPHAIDFRRVYATLLDSWLRVPSTPILNGTFDPLPILRA